MNRNNEYNMLLKELDDTPIQLEYSYQRAKAKLKRSRSRKLFTIPFSSVMLSIVLFIISINCFPTFAYACSKIPLIKELAELVNFSSSLTAAIENEYVQVIEQEQTSNGITARVEYLIVDQKQLLVFYTLDSKEYQAMSPRIEIKAEDGSPLSGYSLVTTDFGKENGELRYVTIDFVDRDIPPIMLFELYVNDNGSLWKTERADSKVENEMFQDEDEIQEYKEHEYISKFTFNLEFDPYFTAQGIDIKLNEEITIDNQTLMVETANIYPTHIRIEFSDKAENTAWLKDISFYLENEKGEKFNAVSNGITATGDPNSPMMKSHRLESTFFSQSKELYLYITGVVWLDKDMEKIELDLANVTADKLPEGVEFDKAEKKDNGWLLTFTGKRYKENATYQLFNSHYYDISGNKYDINSWSTSTYWSEEVSKQSPDDKFITQLPLKNYQSTRVYMAPLFSRNVVLDEPIVVKIK